MRLSIVVGLLALTLPAGGGVWPSWDREDPLAGARVPARPLSARRQDKPTFRAQTRLVLVDAVVKDKKGRFIKELTPRDFQLAVDGRPAPVEHVAVDQWPLAVALVLDQSGSLQPHMEDLRSAAEILLAALKTDDRVMVVTFAAAARLHTPLTANKPAAADIIGALDVDGRQTNINDGLYSAAYLLRTSRAQERRVMVLVSDGCATLRRDKGPQDVVNMVLAGEAAFYDVPVGDVCLPGASGNEHVDLQVLTEETGGERLRAGSLEKDFKSLVESLRNRYTLGFAPSSDDAGFHRLELTLAPRWGVEGRDYTIQARKSFYTSSRR